MDSVYDELSVFLGGCVVGVYLVGFSFYGDGGWEVVEGACFVGDVVAASF